MITISITSVMVAMMTMNHIDTLKRAEFNQNVEYFYAHLKECGSGAKRFGMVITNPLNALSTYRKAKDERLSVIIDGQYLAWVICSRDNATSPIRKLRSGAICNRSPIRVKSSSTYISDKAVGVTTGLWVDLFAINKPEDVNTINLTAQKPVARIIFDATGLPNKAGIITLEMMKGSNIVRGERIDIERSGVIVLNTENSTERLGGE